MDRANWDDLRYVLAVAEAGSVSAAARKLGVNHATVLRRIAAFEELHGAPVFDRSAQGYQIAPDKLRLIEAARDVSHAFESVARMLKGVQTEVSGVVRITSTDSLCLHVLPEVVAEVIAESPSLRIELLATNAHVDLARLQADLTVRPAAILPDDLLGEQVGVMRFGVYGPAAGPSVAADMPWLGLRGPLGRSKVADWTLAQAGDQSAGAAADSFVILRELVAQGLGKSVLPICIAQNDARLVRIDMTPNLEHVPIWVASHADLGDVPRLRLLRHRLAAGLRSRMI